MNLDTFIDYCTSKKAVQETFPFDETTLALKVMGKIFAITDIDQEELRINLKCDPEWAVQLREQYAAIHPGYHMNKIHWITVRCQGGDITDELIYQLIDQSYELVVAKLKKSDRLHLDTL